MNSAVMKVVRAFFIALLLYVLNAFRKVPRNIKWIFPTPLLGRMQIFFKDRRRAERLKMVESYFRQIGPTYAYFALFQPAILTINPANIEHILNTRFENYVKGHVFNDLTGELLGKGIFNVDGEDWRNQRKIMSHMFTERQFENHIGEVVTRKTAKVLESLRQTGSDTIDMFNLLNRFTLDTTCEIAFGKDVNSLENPNNPFLISFDKSQTLIWKRIVQRPLWKIKRKFGIGSERELQSHISCLRAYVQTVITDLDGKLAGGEDSFIGIFLKSNWLKEKGITQQHQFLSDMALNFIIAGRDTTAQCLSWTLLELLQHPNVVERAREEIDTVCGEGPLELSQHKELLYIQAILDEGLRLHPSVPGNTKLALHDDILPDGTHVPAGCIVGYQIRAQGRCEDQWGKNASQYYPERWLDMKEHPSPYAHTVFNAGRRTCLGKRLAGFEMRTLLVSVLQNFDFILQVEPSSIHPTDGLTLGMSGLPVKVIPRSKKF